MLCAQCKANTPDGAICRGCIHAADRHLVAILDLHTRANWAPNLQPTRTGEPGPRHAREAPLPVDVNVLDLALGHDLLRHLDDWERDWRHTFGPRHGLTRTPPPRPATRRTPGTPEHHALIGAAQFLRAWGPTAAVEYPGWIPYAHDVERLHAHAAAILGVDDTPPGRVTCPCGARITLDPAGMTCPGCGTTWNLARLLACLDRPLWLPREIAVLAYGNQLGPLVRDGAVRRRGQGPLTQYLIGPKEAM